MGKHTTGPWRIAGKATIRAGNDAWIANVHFANREANARLIAASPTLLEALEALLAECGDAGADGYVENSIHIDEVRAARAAITLATGKDA